MVAYGNNHISGKRCVTTIDQTRDCRTGRPILFPVVHSELDPECISPIY